MTMEKASREAYRMAFRRRFTRRWSRKHWRKVKRNNRWLRKEQLCINSQLAHRGY